MRSSLDALRRPSSRAAFYRPPAPLWGLWRPPSSGCPPAAWLSTFRPFAYIIPSCRHDVNRNMQKSQAIYLRREKKDWCVAGTRQRNTSSVRRGSGLRPARVSGGRLGKGGQRSLKIGGIIHTQYTQRASNLDIIAYDA